MVAVEAGSAGPPSAFAWAAFAPPAREPIMSGSDPQSAVSAAVAGLAWGGQAVLLLASPLSVTDPAGQAGSRRLPAKVHAGEGYRTWPAGAGVLATGPWMLSQLAVAVPGLSVTTQPDQWQAGAAPLLLAEAGVAGPRKPALRPAGQAAADAEAAGLALVDLLTTSASLAARLCCSSHAPFNLLAAMAVGAGLGIDPSELNQDLLVIAAHPG